MEVLRKGRDQKGLPRERVCAGRADGGCGAILLVAKGDVECRLVRCFDDLVRRYHFVCPECGAETEVKDFDSW